jgi:DNA invertase Pin-like site-specific DNA recombinase
MSVFFYSRISSISQNSQRQIENFKKHQNFDVKNLFMDKIQGNVPFMERPEAIKLFDAVTSNSNQLNTVVVDSIERLGRSLLDILNTIQVFTSNKINLHSLKEGFSTLLEDGRENPMAKLVVACMGSIGELERNKIKERCAEGVAIARGAGKYTGRKHGSFQSNEKAIQRHADVVLKLKKNIPIRDVSVITGKSTATIIKVKKILIQRNEI